MARRQCCTALSETIDRKHTKKRPLALFTSFDFDYAVDRTIVAQAVWLEDSGRDREVPKVRPHRGASYLELGPAIYVGHGLCARRAYFLVWQTRVVCSAVGMVYA